jgi:hypothetical protein
MVGTHVAIGHPSVLLYDIIENEIRSSLPYASRSHNLIVNEISPGIFVRKAKDTLINALRELLSTVTKSSKGSYIRISAKRFHNIVLLHIRNYNILDKQKMPYDIGELQKLSAKINGYIGITSQRLNETTIALSFPDVV